MWPEDAVRNGLAVPPDHSSRSECLPPQGPRDDECLVEYVTFSRACVYFASAAAPTRQTTPWPGQGAVGPSLPDPNAAMADGKLRAHGSTGHCLSKGVRSDRWIRLLGVTERKEKSLGRLSQKFIQLFLIGVSGRRSINTQS
jgi:hypothetical protein